MNKRRIILILSTLALLSSLSVMAYPMVANTLNEKYQSIVQAEYTRDLASVDDGDILAAREAARAYNEGLHPIRYDRDAVDAAAVNYDSLLDLTGTGIMGYVEIPKIRVNLPIYHGTEETELRKGIGHLVGSSLPIGGMGEHSVLTGHSGVAKRRLFSDLEQLAKGDRFYLHILGETLAYKVTEINTVLPHETDLLTADPDDDLCTLVTCTPYGVNTHRLLVRGSRISARTSDAVDKTVESSMPVPSTWATNYRNGLLIGCGLALCAILLCLLIALLRKKWRSRHET